jgi:flagella basal body P-ring formation protein FlgA
MEVWAMHNGRPLGIRKTVQLMVILTLLAWATQTLLAQWGFGAEITATTTVAGESFVPRLTGPSDAGATISLRAEACVPRGEVRLRRVCRWSDRDAAFFAPLGDLVVMRLGDATPFQAISVSELKGVLSDAGVNLGDINFAGATSCTVARTDVKVDEADALAQWAGARQPPSTQPQAAALPDHTATAVLLSPQASASAPVASAGPAEPQSRSLRELLVADLADRVGVATQALAVTFSPKHEKLLSLSEPLFQFDIKPQRSRGLGAVNWQVTVLAESQSQPLNIEGTAKAWQDQLVLDRPLSAGQIVRASDVVERRVLVDRLDSEPLINASQAVGNQTVRDLKPGTVLTAKMIEAVPLVRTGQFVTVTLTSGGVRVKTVARAMDDGAFGESIRVKNEATKEIYQVSVTGPQAAEMNVGDPQTRARLEGGAS